MPEGQENEGSRKPLFGSVKFSLKGDKSVRKSLAVIYALPERNEEFSSKSAIIYCLGFGIFFGAIVFFLSFVTEASTNAQWFFAATAFLFGITSSLISDYFKMGFGLSKLVSIFFAALFFSGAYIVASSAGWIAVK